MAAIESVFVSGRIVDIMLLFIAIELTLIAAFGSRSGRGIALRPLLVNAGAGGSLMLALRAALTDAAWTVVAAFVALAMVFHIMDLLLRWQSSAIVGQRP